jgi:O-antigen/teichoic acid export membrane protein
MAILGRLRGSEFGGLAGDAAWSAIWQGAISVADLLQIALISHALGLKAFGQLALATSFVFFVGQFFDLRVGAAATAFGGRWIDRDPAKAAGVFQLTFIVDVVTGVAGFLVVLALTPLIGDRIVGTSEGSLLIIIYAGVLLLNTAEESASSVVRLCGRFRLIAGLSIALETVRVVGVAVVLQAGGTLQSVLLFLLAHQALRAVTQLASSTLVYRKRPSAPRLTENAMPRIRAERREILLMMVHTNVVSYARAAQVQLPPLLIGAFAGATEVGLYKVGMAGAALVGRITDPPMIALLPRIARLLPDGRRAVRRLVGQASLAAGVAITGMLVLLAVFSGFVLRTIGGDAAAAGTAILLVGALAQAVNGVVFWNVGVLYAMGESRYMARLAVASGVSQVMLTVGLVAAYGTIGAAIALLCVMLATNVAATRRALARLA